MQRFVQICYYMKSPIFCRYFLLNFILNEVHIKFIVTIHCIQLSFKNVYLIASIICTCIMTTKAYPFSFLSAVFSRTFHFEEKKKCINEHVLTALILHPTLDKFNQCLCS